MRTSIQYAVNAPVQVTTEQTMGMFAGSVSAQADERDQIRNAELNRYSGGRDEERMTSRSILESFEPAGSVTLGDAGEAECTCSAGRSVSSGTMMLSSPEKPPMIFVEKQDISEVCIAGDWISFSGDPQ